jgi:hypothetical protein
VVAFNDVGRVNKLSDLRWILEKGGQLIPVGAPGTENKRILASPNLFKTVQFQ